MATIVGQPVKRVSVVVAGVGECDVQTVDGKEQFSYLFDYRVRFRTKNGVVTPPQLIGREATLKLHDSSHAERDVTGLVIESHVEPHEHGEDWIEIVIRPFAYPLILGRDSRAFHDLDAVAIVKAVLDGAGVPARFEITGSYPVRDYTVQYRESDWEFICRLLEEEGIFFWFDHTEKSKLVIGDKSSAAEDLPGGAELVYKGESELVPGKDFIFEFGATHRLRPRRFTLASFDFAKPSAKVEADAGDDGLEVYDAPGAGLVDAGALAVRAQARKDAAAVEAFAMEGRTPSVRLSPGRAFELVEHPVARFDGRYVVIEVLTKVTQADATQSVGQGHELIVQMRSLPADQPFRPAIVTKVPTRPGLQSGQVVGAAGDEVMPDAQGRVRVQQHFDRLGEKNEKAGHFIRVTQRGTTGSMLLPRVGWNVLSVNEEGSPDVPVLLNRTFDGEHMPPYTLPDNKTRVVYKTATTPGDGTFNEIRFEDREGDEEMFINSTKDYNVLVQDKKTDLVRRDMTRSVGVDHDLTVGDTYDDHIKINQTVDVGGNQSLDIADDRSKLIAGSETIKIGGNRSIKTGATLSTNAKNRSLTVGAAQLDTTIGPVLAQSTMINEIVGGAVIKATPKTMVESVGQNVSVNTLLGAIGGGAAGALGSIPGSSAVMSKLPSGGAGCAIQTVGVAKIELGLSRTINTTTSYAEKVGGMMTLKTQGGFTDIVTAGPMDLSALSIVQKTKKLTITSETSVTLKVGGTTLTVSAKEGIKLDAPEIQLSGASALTAKASQIKHNDG